MEYNHQAAMRHLYGFDFVNASRNRPVQREDDEHIVQLTSEEDEDFKRLLEHRDYEAWMEYDPSMDDDWQISNEESRRGRYDLPEPVALFEDDEAILAYEMWRQQADMVATAVPMGEDEVVDMAVKMGYVPSEVEMEHMEDMAMVDEMIQDLVATGSVVGMTDS